MIAATFLAMPPFALGAEGTAGASPPAQDDAPSNRYRMHGMHSAHVGMHQMAYVESGRKDDGRPLWTAYPTLKASMEIIESTDQCEVTVAPQNIVADRIDAYASDEKNFGTHSQLPFSLGGGKLDKVDPSGLYWFSAREEKADAVRIATTVYLGGMGGGMGREPAAMLMQQKDELEIIPQPFSRKYRANEDWKFLVRFNGKPLPGQAVHMATRNGTRIELLADVQGVITARLPDDFREDAEQKPVPQAAPKDAGGHNHNGGRKSSEFVLETEHAEGGKNYVTGFNGSYGPDAYYQRNLTMGLGFTLLGMAGATPLLRQRKANRRADKADFAGHPPAGQETGTIGEV